MSPLFLNEKGIRFFTWSKEGLRRHVHATKGQKYCKYWLEPVIELAENRGFKTHELNQIKEIIEKNEKGFNERWSEHFS